MKYTFETDELADAVILMNANNAFATLWDIDQELRSMYKYGDETTVDTYELRQRLREIMKENGIDLDRMYK